MDWQAFGYAITGAFSGTVSTLLVAELVKLMRRPKLGISIDFSALQEFTTSIPLELQKEIRLKVTNNGKSPAEYCEAKIEPFDEAGNSIFDPSILHWVRRYLEPILKSEDTFSPITINAYDHEYLAMLVLKWNNVEGRSITTLTTASHRPYRFIPNKRYRLRVTIFSKNHKPVRQSISLFWDGRWESFTKASVSPDTTKVTV